MRDVDAKETRRRGGLGGPIGAALLVLVALPALAAGRPALNAYFQSTLADTVYHKKTFDRVARAWKSPPQAAFPKLGAKTVVQAVISRDGRIVSTLVSTVSGSKVWDAAARKGIEDAAPFDPLPPAYKPATLEVHFHFSVVK